MEVHVVLRVEVGAGLEVAVEVAVEVVEQGCLAVEYSVPTVVVW